MSIRSKLIAAIVAVSLIGGILFGAFTYQDAAQTLERMSLRQLETVAAAKQSLLDQTLAAWGTTTRLIAGSNQLKSSVDAYFVEPRTRVTELPRIDGLLKAAIASNTAIKRITIYDRTGERATSVGTSETPLALALPPADVDTGYQSTHDASSTPEVTYHAGLDLGDRPVGALEIVFDGAAVDVIAARGDGLGETGETLILLATDDHPRLLTKLRHAGEFRPDSPQALATLSESAQSFSAAADYRGVAVLAATRRLDDIGWGVIVKADRAEMTQPAAALRDRLVLLGVALAGAAIAAGIWLAGRIAPAAGRDS